MSEATESGEATAIYPWHEESWQRFTTLVDAQKLPHALLLSGSKFLGKRQFALRLAEYLLCQSPKSGERCGHCKACLLLSAGTHPDLIRVSPPLDKKEKKPKKEIPVETIRELKESLLQTSQQGGNKVCLLQPAEKMNENSASALLKLLEEPPANTFFLLVADEPHRLMPTLLSRCQQQLFYKPDVKVLRSWLKGLDRSIDVESVCRRSRGYPGIARQLRVGKDNSSNFPELIGEIFAGELSALVLAAKLGVDDYQPFIDECQLMVHAALRSVSGAVTSEAANVSSPLKQVSGPALQQINDILFDTRRQFEGNANKRLLFESALSKCQQLLPKSI